MAEWKFNGFAHGADYYPEQWLSIPGMMEEDIRLMKLAHINIVTLGTFAWAALEPEEGKYCFEWMDAVLAQLHANGISVILSTPSGARPAWLSASYPEVLRVTENRFRNLHGMRMNHCYTSAKYRELTHKIDEALAKRYACHPAVKGWHISNEYHGECHCELCQEAFRSFLQEKYITLEQLNHAWWTGFWSKTYTDWSQICSPSSRGEKALQGLEVDWLRFVTRQTKEFMRLEIEAVRPYNPALPVTTNMIGSFIEVDYPKLVPLLDIASLDVYPEWGGKTTEETAAEAGFEYDITRSLKKQPFLLMETTPSMTNWGEVGKPKKPGIHLAGCLQAVAHGAESVLYFQWRKSRGGFEKFHGAVVGHTGHENTRVFEETAQVGKALEKIGEVAGAVTKAEAALLFDWNNRWAVNASKGPRAVKPLDAVAREHYLALRRQGINVDIIDQEQSFDGYKLIVAPMMYMVKEGVSPRLEQFVREGGILVGTYFSGIADENDLCFIGGAPGPLKKVFGIWVEELDSLYPEERNRICFLPDNDTGLTGSYSCDYFCEIIHCQGAVPAAVYGEDYYQGTPAVTCNTYGKGMGCYLAAHTDRTFLTDFYRNTVKKAGITPLIAGLPHSVSVTSREKAGDTYLFLINFQEEAVTVHLPEGIELLTGEYTGGFAEIEKNGVRIVKFDSGKEQL